MCCYCTAKLPISTKKEIPCMRITKVKVDKQDVGVLRDEKEGFLQHGNVPRKGTDPSNDCSITTFLHLKDESFKTSVLNKTLVKPKPYKQKENQPNNALELKKLFQFILSIDTPNHDIIDLNCLKKLNKIELISYFGHKFTSDEKIKGMNPDFNLIDALYSALQARNNLKDIAQDLAEYKKWATDYINNKKYHLAHSIENNKIDYQGETSPRKKALNKWAIELINKNAIDINPLQTKFKLNELCAKWNEVWRTEDKQTPEEVIKINQAIQQAKESKQKIFQKKLDPKQNGLPKDLFSFKCRLKKELQQHQSALISELKNDIALSQYSLEISKYLSLYFPLKKSDKKLSIEDIPHYLAFNTIVAHIAAQIKNATLQYIIQQGKAINYELGTNISSDDLSTIKTQETFALKFIDACAFAANNLRNSIDPEQQSDILGKKEIKASLTKILDNPIELTIAKQKLTQFFLLSEQDSDNKLIYNHKKILNHLNQSDENFQHFVTGIRSAIQSIRNDVIHYQKGAYDAILDIKTIESLTAEQPDIDYKDSYFQTLINHEISTLPQLMAEKLRSSGLFEFYPVESLSFFSKLPLVSRSLAFIPSFKNIFNWGTTYQTDKKADGTIIYDLKLSHYFKREKIVKDRKTILNPKDEAHYFALKLIYENKFISDFLDNEIYFSDAVDQVLKTNQHHAKLLKQAKKNDDRISEDAWAFHEIISYNDWKADVSNPTINEYLKFINSALIIEENRKREDGVLESTETGHFQKFMWQVFLKGFDAYLNASELQFIAKSQDQFEHLKTAKQKADALNEITKNFAIDVKNSIADYPEPSCLIAFWVFCKLLDAQHLNELMNQFTKWSQTLTNAIDIHKIKIQQEIIALCLLTADLVPSEIDVMYTDSAQCLESLRPYTTLDINLMRQQATFFSQEDGGKPIIFAHVELAKRYGTAQLLKTFFEEYPQFKVSQIDLTKWKDKTRAAGNLIETRQKMHQQWVQATQKTSRGKKGDKYYKLGWLDMPYSNTDERPNKEVYTALCEQADAFNWLDNKVHLVHIKQLHHLLIEILGRLVGFVAIFDRDFQFLDLGASEYRKDDPYRLIEFISFQYVISELKKGKVPKELKSIINVSDKQTLDATFTSLSLSEQKNLLVVLEEKRQIYVSIFFEKDFNVFEKRNYLAHFNYLTKKAHKFSLLDLLKHVRSLVAYDRKLKNGVAKAFIDLLGKHGIEIKFEPLHKTKHEFIIKSIEPKKITHLGGAKVLKDPNGNLSAIQSDQVHPEYVKMVKALLEFKTTTT